MLTCRACNHETSTRNDGSCSACRQPVVGQLDNRMTHVTQTLLLGSAEEFAMALASRLSFVELRSFLFLMRDVVLLSLSPTLPPTALVSVQNDKTGITALRQFWFDTTKNRVGRTEIFRTFWLVAEYSPLVDEIDQIVRFEVRMIESRLTRVTDHPEFGK